MKNIDKTPVQYNHFEISVYFYHSYTLSLNYVTRLKEFVTVEKIRALLILIERHRGIHLSTRNALF